MMTEVNLAAQDRTPWTGSRVVLFKVDEASPGGTYIVGGGHSLYVCIFL
jgi:hypothetical protein